MGEEELEKETERAAGDVGAKLGKNNGTEVREVDIGFNSVQSSREVNKLWTYVVSGFGIGGH